jgi:hypothetical protein
MEVSGTIAEETTSLLTGWEEIRIVKDLQGISRVIAARRKSSRLHSLAVENRPHSYRGTVAGNISSTSTIFVG